MPEADKSYIKSILSSFFTLNPHCDYSLDDENQVVIEKPWCRDDAKLVGKIEDSDFIEALNNARFSSKFDAIYHADKFLMEFIYSFVNPENESDKQIMDRSFALNFDGAKYQCYFSNPTTRLFAISRNFHRVHFDLNQRSVRQIVPFRDSQKIDQLGEGAKKYFDKRQPRSFFVQCPSESDDAAIEKVARHLNFLMSCYDRKTPIIQIHEEVDNQILPDQIRYISNSFPSEFSLSEIDDFVLKLLEVARFASPRFAFVYYYQVFEYAGYYHLDWDTRSKLRLFLKDPTVINCREEKLTELINILPSLNHNDDVKMKKVIESRCDPRIIWEEIANDKLFFSSEHCFEGGFCTRKLIAETTDLESWNTMWMPKLYDYLTKIRNALVHARERRENKVILPTKNNNQTLERITPVIRRMAEQIAIDPNV